MLWSAVSHRRFAFAFGFVVGFIWQKRKPKRR
jgi:hypothetical protein